MHNYDAYKRNKTSRKCYFLEVIFEANINFKKKLIFETSTKWNKNTSMHVGVPKLSFVLVFSGFPWPLRQQVNWTRIVAGVCSCLRLVVSNLFIVSNILSVIFFMHDARGWRILLFSKHLTKDAYSPYNRKQINRLTISLHTVVSLLFCSYRIGLSFFLKRGREYINDDNWKLR